MQESEIELRRCCIKLLKFVILPDALYWEHLIVAKSTTYICQEGGNFPLYPFWVLMAGLITKMTQDRLTGERETNFNS